MQLIKDLFESIQSHFNKNAFCIADKFYTYEDLASSVSKIRFALQALNENDKFIGLMANDDLETYASIIALWAEGKAYIPIHPRQPVERNLEVAEIAGIKTILNSGTTHLGSGFNYIETKKLEKVIFDKSPVEVQDNEFAYILFTSGSTGKPKGVPITRYNLSSFVEAFWDIGYEINHTDRVLQGFDLTFDLSVMSYLIPLLKGACTYTVPVDEIKYTYIYGLLDEHKITLALMVPSTIHYLRPYFDEIQLPDLRYSLFCGEALYLDVLSEWSKCVPNAVIHNVYGPTEATIFCTFLNYNSNGENKAFNGIMSIGKAMKGMEMIIVDENLKLLKEEEKGELCLSGNQLTPGYWNNEEKNKEVFFDIEVNNTLVRYYRTGDLCFYDHDGDFIYAGRLDFQAKIQGYRVELGEIEYHVKAFLKNRNAVAVVYNNQIMNTEIALIIEGTSLSIDEIVNYLRQKLPPYMIPAQIHFENSFPLNVNGKIDRKALTKKIK